MSDTTTPAERVHEALTRWQEDLGSTEAELEYMSAVAQRDRFRAGAVSDAIAAEGVPISVMERNAIDASVSLYMDRLDSIGEFAGEPVLTEAAKLQALRLHVADIVTSPLRLKQAVALELEMQVSDCALPADGVLGRALDQAIDQLAPYVAGRPEFQENP